MSARLLGLLLVAVGLLSHPAWASDVPGAAIVFVPPARPEVEAAMVDALTAQLSGSAAAAVFESFTADSGGLRRQVAEARSLAAAHQAKGVFWLDTQSDTDWLLYLAEPGGDRVLVRRVAVDPASLAAAVEAVAVITRQSSDALLAGQTIGMRPVSLPEDEPPRSPAAPAAPGAPPMPGARPRTRAWSFGVGVVGDSPWESAEWQVGLRLSGRVRSASGFSLGLGYALLRDTAVQTQGITFRIARTPLDLGAGFILGSAPLAAAFELRGIAEFQSRQSLAVEPPLEQTGSSLRTALFVAPRVGLEWHLSPLIQIRPALGIDVALNRFPYLSRGDDGYETLVQPRRIRPAAELQVAFSP